MATAVSHFCEVEDLGGRRRQATVLAYPKYALTDWRNPKSPLVLADTRLRRVADGWEMGYAVHRVKVYDDGRIAYGHLDYSRILRPARRVLTMGRSPEVTKELRGPSRVVEISETELLLENLADGIDLRVSVCHDGLSFVTEARLDKELRKAEGLRIDFDDSESGTFFGRVAAGRVRHAEYIEDASGHDVRSRLSVPETQTKRTGSYSIGVALAELAEWPDGKVRLNDDVTYQEGVSGYSGYDDNMLYGGGDTLNFGTRAFITVGRNTSDFDLYRGIIRWDVTAVPAGASCDAATMAFKVRAHEGSPSIDVFRILSANASWVSGTTNGQAENGSSCWGKRVYNTTDWAGSAGCGTAGNDYDASGIGAQTWSTNGATMTYTLTAEDEAYLAAKFGGDDADGWIVIGGEGSNAVYGQFHSAEAATAGDRPVLSITYTAAGGTAYTMDSAAGAFTLTGKAAALQAARFIVPGVGAFALTGQAAALLATRTMGAGLGGFDLTGQAAGLLATRLIVPGVGEFSLTGKTVGLQAARTLAAGLGEFSLTGQTVGLTAARLIIPGVGTFALTGKNVSLDYSGATATTGTPIYYLFSRC